MDRHTLRAYRQALGMTQVELAEVLETTGTTISRWEQNAKPIGNARILELALLRLLDEQRARRGGLLSQRPAVSHTEE